MLTISQLAEYAGTTVRAIRHYHAIGLLPEPERTSSGYRSYGAQAIVDLTRIRTLADAGVPLRRIEQLIHAEPHELRTAVEEIDRDLKTRIDELKATRKALARLGAEDEPFLPERIHFRHQEMRQLGISEYTIEMEREHWILVNAVFPEAVDAWFAGQESMMADPEYWELYRLTDQAFQWQPHDPRIEDLVQRTVAFIRRSVPPHVEGVKVDQLAYHLVTTYRAGDSPAWARVMERLREELGD